MKPNSSIASIFHHMADCYRYLGREENFRANAYENASKILETIDVDITVYKGNIHKLEEIGGIGESIAEKIEEYLKTGKIRTFESLKKKVPFELLELMDITGFGPVIIRKLHEKLGIGNRAGLTRALKTGKLKMAMGFGEKKIENMERALKLVNERKRFSLAEARLDGRNILNYIKKIPGVQEAELAGSLRRKKETIGDIDLIIVSDTQNRKKIADRICSWPAIEEVLAKGNTKISLILHHLHIQVDIRLVKKDEFGAAMLYYTGSREHTIKLRTIAKKKGYKINEYGIFETRTGKKLAGSTEAGIYNLLGLDYIRPENRLGNEEFEKSLLPK